MSATRTPSGMSVGEIRQIAEWLTEHGFTVLVDYDSGTITIRL